MAATGKSTEHTIQTAVFHIELGRGKAVLQWVLVVLLAVGLSLVYTAGQFRGLQKREAMDMAQLARNIARGQGFTTYLIRPLSLWHLKTYSESHEPHLMNHPDLVNPPLYPLVLAGLFKSLPPTVFEYSRDDRVYAPERWVILPFNQICLLLTLLLVFWWAKQLFDRRVAVTVGFLLLFSDTLWNYGVSGLATNFLMLLLLLAAYLLYLADRRLNPPISAETEQPAPSSQRVTTGTMTLIVLSAVLMGLCFLTRYLAAFLLLPMALYAARMLRGRGGLRWAAVYVLVFLVVITPWLVRNYNVSRSFLGLAKYSLIENTPTFNQDVLQRSYDPDLSAPYSVRTATSTFLSSMRTQLIDSFRQIGSDCLIFFFAVGVMYGFRRGDVTRLRGLVLGGLACGMVGMALITVPNERWGPSGNSANLLVLFLPVVAIYGVAFFYLLLDRIPFRIRLTRALAIGAFALLNVSPMIFSLLPPRRGAFPYPPYFTPMTHAVAKLFEKDEVGTTDLPWSMAWDGDRRAVWLPMTIEGFYEIHDFVAPKGVSFMMLTPQMLDQAFQTGILQGPYKGWASVVRGQLPMRFPLKSATALPPRGDQYLFADRVRWGAWQDKSPEVPPVSEEEEKERKAQKSETTPAPSPPPQEEKKAQ